MARIIGGPAAWRGPQIADRSEWKTELNETHRSELLAALAAIDRPGRTLRDIGRDNFALPTLGPVLAGV